MGHHLVQELGVFAVRLQQAKQMASSTFERTPLVSEATPTMRAQVERICDSHHVSWHGGKQRLEKMPKRVVACISSIGHSAV